LPAGPLMDPLSGTRDPGRTAGRMPGLQQTSREIWSGPPSNGRRVMGMTRVETSPGGGTSPAERESMALIRRFSLQCLPP
jgi:hypothetical protein